MNRSYYGFAANAAIMRGALCTGIDVEKAKLFARSIFKIFGLKGNRSYEEFLDILADEPKSFQLLSEIIVDSDSIEEFYNFAISFIGPCPEEGGHETDKPLSEEVPGDGGNPTSSEQHLHVLESQIKTRTFGKGQLINYIDIPQVSFTEIEGDLEIAEHLKVLIEIGGDEDAIKRLLLLCESLDTGILACKYLSTLLPRDDIACDEDFGFEDKLGVVKASEIDKYMGSKGFDSIDLRQGNFGFQGLQRSEVDEPWWLTHDTLPMIIVVDDNMPLSSDFSVKLGALGQARENIFVVYVRQNKDTPPQSPEFLFGNYERTGEIVEDISFSLGYFVYSISDPKLTSEYMKKVLTDAAFVRAHSLAEDVDVEDVLKNIRMRRGGRWAWNTSVVQLVEKVISLRRGAPGTIARTDFDFLSSPILSRNTPTKKNAERATKSAWDTMNERVYGLDHVKGAISDIVKTLEINQTRRDHGLKGSNVNKVMVFTGPPGVGKTTIAQYTAEILFENKLLEGSKFLGINASELKAKYVGHTSERVKEIFRNNDAILIDECYSIAHTQNGEMDTFASDAISQIVIEIESHAQSKLVIFAGYNGEKMQQFLNSNPGLSSRINFYVDFPPYTAEGEMPEIFRCIAESRDFIFEEGWKGIAVKFFKRRQDSRSFGNGREARKLLDHCIYAQARRLGDRTLDKESLRLISCDDIASATANILDGERSVWGEVAKTTIGF